MTRRRTNVGRPRGRSVAAAVLLGFVVVATAVIWRRGYGVAHSMEFRQLDRQRVQLQAQRAALERQIHELTGRAHLGVIAERQLDMRVPPDSQVIVLPAPASAVTSTPTSANAGGTRAAP
jgi:cell division protein FtsB